MKTQFPPPQTIQELMQRADNLAGRTIGEIALQINIQLPHNPICNTQIPTDLKIKKGWQGQFIENCLGADSGNLSQPDFNHLGIELKTLPIDLSGRVEESTYVCILNFSNHQLLH